MIAQVFGLCFSYIIKYEYMQTCKFRYKNDNGMLELLYTCSGINKRSIYPMVY